MTSSKHGETLDTLLTREQREELTALVTSACNRMRENICTTFDALPATPPAQTPPAPTSQQDPSEKLSAQHLDGQKLENIPPQTSETKPDSGGSELTQPKSETVQLPTNPQLEILKKNCLSSFDEWQEPIIKRIKEVVDPKNVSGKSGSATEVSAENDAQNDILQSMYPPIETSLLALPQAHRNTVLQSLLLLFLSLGNYDSRSRVLLLVIASSLHIPLAVALEQEDHTANTIIKAAEKSKDMTAEEESKKRVEENKFSRGWKIGLASVAGAAVIGITGGLAAPLVAAGIGSVMSGIGLGATAAAGYLGAVASSGAIVGAMFGAYGAKMTGEMMDRYSAEVEDFAFIPIKEKGDIEKKKLKVTIGVSGWLTSPEGIVSPWRVLNSDVADVYALRWETTALTDLGTSLQSYLTSYAWGYVKHEVIKRTVLATLYSAFWPVGLLKFARVIDNPYSIARHRSEKAGLVLADALINHCQGLRPVTLIGFSLGSRVIYSCLLSLAQRGEFGLISDVYLLGSPIPTKPSEWKAMRSVVAGKLVNGHSELDWVLGFLERGSSLAVGVAGIQDVHLNGVDNIDLGKNKLVEGHLRYGEVMGVILKEMGLGTMGELEMGEVGWEEEVLKKVRRIEQEREEEAKVKMEQGQESRDEHIEEAVKQAECELEERRKNREAAEKEKEKIQT